jgi:alpha,alpha-trehalase
MFNLWRPQKQNELVAKSANTVKTAVVQTAGALMPVSESPEEALKALFEEVQQRQVYPDGKTFADMIPRQRIRRLLRTYEAEQSLPDFDLHAFVDRHFYEFLPGGHEVHIQNNVSTREHVRNLWPQLQRRNRRDRGSLVAVPHEYVVPGGRFSEQFYWDSYFIMLGLAADEHWDIIEGMMKNYMFMIFKFGRIPTANRTYFLTRSQPPFFAHMVRLLAKHNGRTRTFAEYLPSLLLEYRFWMKGRRDVVADADLQAKLRVVCMPNGVVLNRYFDDKATPRPESHREDAETAAFAITQNKRKVYRDLRAAAESGWDFSSRWFSDPNKIETIHTTDMVQVDLNCLLYQLEMTIADAYTALKQPLLSRKFRQAAEKRADAIRRYCWNPETQFFEDYNFRTGTTTGKATLAGAFPLYAKIATSEQATAVAKRIESDFLKKGGLITTLETTAQQWDAPNGWAPLQWTTIQGLRAYGHHTLANRIRDRWLEINDRVYETTHKMVEKYDVVTAQPGGGGEYPLQDGFGWTNGVYAALYDERRDKRGG